jgi:LuxR family maltose regulon positive regulatory protein
MRKTDQKDLPVVRTKLHAPRIPSDLVRRDRLHELLAQNPSRPFTLVSAPAGYGKSTLVAHWLTTADLANAWLSVGKSDNDIRQFLIYLIAAVRTHSRNACAATLRLLCAPELPPLASLREQLSNDLDAIRKPFVLVLDDFHLIERTEIHEIINHLLNLPPRSLHLVIVTRHDPPVELTKLRAGGRMVDVRERDLRFTEEETCAVLQRLAGIEIAGELLTHIHSELEGWIVGLRLVCLALQNRDDPESFLRSLSGGTPTMQDYLTREVLSQQPDAFRRFLLSSAIVDRFCAPLCTAVCGLGGGRDSGRRFVSQLV